MISIIDPIDSSDTIAASTILFTYWHCQQVAYNTSSNTRLIWKLYQLECQSHDPSFPDDYLVLVSTTDNQITSFTDTSEI